MKRGRRRPPRQPPATAALLFWSHILCKGTLGWRSTRESSRGKWLASMVRSRLVQVLECEPPGMRSATIFKSEPFKS